ncbi:MAG TPA: SET domain-containing protein [Candidatus Yonathbacteria bacterium]|nr:SET domain-containing protein [Candidatus Yonathbacteria bacterium]
MVNKNTQKAKKTKKNKNFDVKRSSAGLGLFAARNFVYDDFLIEYVGEVLTPTQADDKGGKYLFTINSRKVIDGTPRHNIARYINHSCKPNAEAVIEGGNIMIYATKKIKKGEELSYDYGKEYFNDHIKPYGCRCGTHEKSKK